MKLFDLHCDTLYECEKQGCSLMENTCHIDLRRGLSLYDTWGQVMAMFVPDTLRGDDAWQHVQRMLTLAQHEEAAYPNALALVKTTGDMQAALARHQCAALLAVEGGAAIGGDISRLEFLSQSGVIAINITWNGSNELANGCMSPDTAGLTAVGQDAVREMFRVGIVPDVSHLNEHGFWDVADIAGERPFLAGHSLSKTVCDHPRNLTDEQFAAVRDSGGLVGLNVCADQLGGHTFGQIERHLERYLSLDGERTVALGCDLDGTDIPEEWDGIAFAGQFYGYLRQKGYGEALLSALFYENAHAFFVKALTRKQECITIGI